MSDTFCLENIDKTTADGNVCRFLFFFQIMHIKNTKNNMQRKKGKSMTKNMKIYKDMEDSYTAIHSCRVAKIAHILGIALNLCEDELAVLDEASELHDVGKIMVNQSILNKPDKLNDEEYAEIKKHTEYGYSIVQAEDSALADIIISHHERFDGRGYPNGLSGNSIPFLARVIAVADSLDAMGSDRCYRKALPWSICVSEIRKNDGKMYDPDVVRAFYLSQDEILKFFS